MARHPEATREAVWAAMERLKAEGDPKWDGPSRLRTAIGGVGSFTTISRYRDEWLAARGGPSGLGEEAVGIEDKQGEVGLPSEAREVAGDAIAKAIDRTWHLAREHAAASAHKIKQAAIESMNQAKREKEEALAEAERLEMLLVEVRGDRDDLRARVLDHMTQLEREREASVRARDVAMEREDALRAHCEQMKKRMSELEGEVLVGRSELLRVSTLLDLEAQARTEIQSRLAECEALRREETRRYEVALEGLSQELREEKDQLQLEITELRQVAEERELALHEANVNLALARASIGRKEEEVARLERDKSHDDELKQRDQVLTQIQQRLVEVHGSLEVLTSRADRILKSRVEK